MKNIMKNILVLVLALCALLTLAATASAESAVTGMSSREASLMTIIEENEHQKMMFVQEGDLDRFGYAEVEIESFDGVYLFANNKGLIGEVLTREGEGRDRASGNAKEKVVSTFFSADGEIKDISVVREGYVKSKTATPKLFKGINVRFVQIEGENFFRLVIAGKKTVAKATDKSTGKVTKATDKPVKTADTTDEIAEQMTSKEASLLTIVTEDNKSKVMMIRKKDLKELDYEEIEITDFDGVYSFANGKGIIGEVYGREDRVKRERDLSKVSNKAFAGFFTKTGEIQYLDMAREGYVKSDEEPVLFTGKSLEKKSVRFVRLDGEDFLRLVIAGGARTSSKSSGGSNPPAEPNEPTENEPNPEHSARPPKTENQPAPEHSERPSSGSTSSAEPAPDHSGRETGSSASTSSSSSSSSSSESSSAEPAPAHSSRRGSN